LVCLTSLGDRKASPNIHLRNEKGKVKKEKKGNKCRGRERKRREKKGKPESGGAEQ
jgi:hypothetical protein